ncbi:MAG: uncharacterized protein PWQ54_1356 [Bacteroidales bacterium]|jgi:uncharacterized membrane protein YfcA|nr:uncharacterized protein [Bacteroidales bacterium]
MNTMAASTVIILILIGLVAGVFSGLIGIGGALIIIPALIFILHMDQYSAQGTSLAIMLPPIGLLAAYNYYKAGALNLQYALIIAAAFFVGGYLGSKIALSIPLEALRKIFAIVLIAIAIKILWSK